MKANSYLLKPSAQAQGGGAWQAFVYTKPSQCQVDWFSPWDLGEVHCLSAHFQQAECWEVPMYSPMEATHFTMPLKAQDAAAGS